MLGSCLWLVLSVVVVFVFCGWDVAEFAVEPFVVEPFDPCECCEFGVFGDDPQVKLVCRENTAIFDGAPTNDLS